MPHPHPAQPRLRQQQQPSTKRPTATAANADADRAIVVVAGAGGVLLLGTEGANAEGGCGERPHRTLEARSDSRSRICMATARENAVSFNLRFVVTTSPLKPQIETQYVLGCARLLCGRPRVPVRRIARSSRKWSARFAFIRFARRRASSCRFRISRLYSPRSPRNDKRMRQHRGKMCRRHSRRRHCSGGVRHARK